MVTLVFKCIYNYIKHINKHSHNAGAIGCESLPGVNHEKCAAKMIYAGKKKKKIYQIHLKFEYVTRKVVTEL